MDLEIPRLRYPEIYLKHHIATNDKGLFCKRTLLFLTFLCSITSELSSWKNDKPPPPAILPPHPIKVL